MAAGSFAFWVSQLLLIVLHEMWRQQSIWVRYGLAAVLVQVVDSIIFFTIAFAGSPSLFEAMAVGFVIKSSLNLASVPLVRRLGLVQYERRASK